MHNLLSSYSYAIFCRTYLISFSKCISMHTQPTYLPQSFVQFSPKAVLTSFSASLPQTAFINCFSFVFTDQTSLLEFLHLLTSNSKIIFSPNNRDEEFIACITHWLLVIGLGKSQPDVENDRVSTGSAERVLIAGMIPDLALHFLIHSCSKKHHRPCDP